MLKLKNKTFFMPLFMDLHKASDYDTRPTVEDIKKNHIADLAVQHKYGVKFIQYWINEEAGMVFCLMEAPNKEACAAVHAEAHGAMPCNVIELQGGDYTAFLNDGTKKNIFDIVEQSDGTLDAGYRTIMVVDFLHLPSNAVLYAESHKVIAAHGGHILQRPGHRLTIIFTTVNAAIECASGIVQYISTLKEEKIEVRIGISVGAPVTEQEQLFADAIQLSSSLCDIAANGQVVVSSMATNLLKKSNSFNHKTEGLKELNAEEENFLQQLTEATASLDGTAMTIDSLAKTVAISRSQLYRKIKLLTGASPNAFMQEQRLQKAVQLIRNNYGNITQVAMEAGFSHLSYFAQIFQKRFGMPPLKAAKLVSTTA
jgi:AraC-like DNA-binding protein